jgi:hypothetical protein
MKENPFNLHGTMLATLIKANGDVEVVHKDNIIVSTGFDFIADSIGKSASRPNAMGYIALGTGTDQSELGQSTLTAEVTRAASTYNHATGTKVFNFTTTFEAGAGTGAITEAGVFNDASGGTMLDRVVFNVINKAEADTLQVTFTFTMS